MSNLILPAGLQAPRPNRHARRAIAANDRGPRRGSAPPIAVGPAPPIELTGLRIDLTVTRTDADVLFVLSAPGAFPVRLPFPPDMADRIAAKIAELTVEIRAQATPQPDTDADADPPLDPVGRELLAEAIANTLKPSESPQPGSSPGCLAGVEPAGAAGPSAAGGAVPV